MKPIRTALASLAATGLLVASPVAAAADVRTGSSLEESEGLAGATAAAWPAIIAILLVGVVSVVSATGDDDDFEPVSP